MIFKNTIKLLLPTFSSVWKTLVWYILVFAVTAGLLMPVLFPLLEAGRNPEIWENLSNVVVKLNAGADAFSLFNAIGQILTELIYVIGALFSALPLPMSYLVFLFFFLLPFLLSLADIPLVETNYAYMSSSTKQSFVSVFIRKLGKSSVLALGKGGIKLLFNLTMIISFYFICTLSGVNDILYYAVPFLAFFSLIVIHSAKQVTVSLWAPAIVVLDVSVMRGFRKGLATMRRDFLRNLSNIIMMTTIVFMLNYLLGPFVFIITIPLSVFIFSLLETTMFFVRRGMSFYIDSDTVIIPPKMQETENIRRLKNLI